MSTYNPDAAIAYAKKYAFHYNPDFPDYSTGTRSADCSNFISQCLFAGGKEMTGEYSKDYTGSWFCYSTYPWDIELISGSWRGISPFTTYWTINSDSYRQFTRNSLTDLELNLALLHYVKIGDPIVLIHANNTPYHALLVVDFIDGDIICAAHTNDTAGTPLRNYNPAQFRVFKV